MAELLYSYFVKGCRKIVHATIPKGNLGYDHYTVPDSVAVDLLLLLSFSTSKHQSMACRAILSKFFEEQWTLKPSTIPFGIVACTFSENLSRNTAVYNFEFNLNFASVFFKAYEYSGACNLSFLKNIQVRKNSKTVNKESRMITLE